MHKARCYYCGELKKWSINLKDEHGIFIKHLNLCQEHMEGLFGHDVFYFQMKAKNNE